MPDRGSSSGLVPTMPSPNQRTVLVNTVLTMLVRALYGVDLFLGCRVVFGTAVSTHGMFPELSLYFNSNLPSLQHGVYGVGGRCCAI